MHAAGRQSGADRILVAATDPVEARKIRSALAAGSWTVSLASGGEEALKASESSDLILLGLPITGPYGRLIVEAVKSRGPSRRPSVLAIVKEGATQDRRLALEAGVEQAITRPLDPVDLLSRVRSLMELRQLRLALAEARELKRVAEEEMQSLRSERASFADKLSHDLKNPLTGIMGHAQMLQMKFGASDPGVERYAGKILGAGRQVQELLADVRDLGLLEQGRFRASPERIDLHSLLSMVVNDHGGAAEAAGVGLELVPFRPDSRKEAILVEVDSGLMIRVLSNLVSNALRHVPPEGRVRVHLGRPSRGRTEIHVSDIADEIPDGPERPRSAGPGGGDARGESRLHHGLRMEFCRVAVEALGGRLWAKPNASGGSTFGLLLPTAGSAGN